MENKQKQKENQIRDKLFNFFEWCNTLQPFKKKLPQEIKSILLIENGYLGDIIAITPCLRAIKQKYPKAKLDVLIRNGMKPILEHNPYVDRVLLFIGKKLKYDVIVVLQYGTNYENIDFSLKLYQKGYKLGLANHGALSSYFPGLDCYVKRKEGLHITEDNLLVLSPLGINNKELFYDLYPTEVDLSEKIQSRHPTIDLTKPYFIIHPGSKNIKTLYSDKYYEPSHWWDQSNWNYVAEKIIEKYDYNIYITGDTSESFIASQIKGVGQQKQIYDMTGLFTLNELFVCIKDAKGIVSMDSGPVHIASALNTPVLSLMGPQDAYKWKPVPVDNNHRFVFHSEGCTSCKKMKCMFNRGNPLSRQCMKLITPKEVMTSVYSMLGYPN